MPTNLREVIYRWEHIDQFLHALMVDLCTRMIDVLEHETPGQQFPKEWTFDVQRFSHKVIAEVWNTRLGSAARSGTNPEFERIAHYLNDGTDPHKITPVNAQALHWEEGGKHFFSKGHVVSGIKASHYREKADRVIEEFLPTIQGKFDAYINYGTLPG